VALRNSASTAYQMAAVWSSVFVLSVHPLLGVSSCWLDGSACTCLGRHSAWRSRLYQGLVEVLLHTLAVPNRQRTVPSAAGRVSVRAPHWCVRQSMALFDPQPYHFTFPWSPLSSMQLAEGHTHGQHQIRSPSAQAACLSTSALQRARAAVAPGDLRLSCRSLTNPHLGSAQPTEAQVPCQLHPST
jgi:hypothetical protein